MRTPLGFFALVILAVEGILAVVAGSTDGADRTFVVIGMVALVLFLVLLVAGMAIWRPHSLYGHGQTAPQDPPSSAPRDSQQIEVFQRIGRPGFFISSFDSRFLAEDARIVTDNFPRSSITTRSASAQGIREGLLNQKFDIVQLTAPNIDSAGAIHTNDGTLSAAGFMELVRHADVSLVVLASCQSVGLAAAAAPHLSRPWRFRKS
ncbi:hypothetical protein [Nocardia sp. CA-120079]|uniref:hypothetical protein n=1 Tax=Nocardia sp. CA-120079 TaxID=3239974 RepID=UPI003D995EBF